MLQAEQFSSLHLIDLLILVPLALIWAVLPEAAAVIAHWLSGYFTKVLFQLPFSRALEAEADEIGLQLTAKVGASYPACCFSLFRSLLLPADRSFMADHHNTFAAKPNTC
jgi:Zn-dependent protease with chaperone function